MSRRIADAHIAIDAHGRQPDRLGQVDKLSHLPCELRPKVPLVSGELIQARPGAPKEDRNLGKRAVLSEVSNDDVACIHALVLPFLRL